MGDRLEGIGELTARELREYQEQEAREREAVEREEAREREEREREAREREEEKKKETMSFFEQAFKELVPEEVLDEKLVKKVITENMDYAKELFSDYGSPRVKVERLLDKAISDREERLSEIDRELGVVEREKKKAEETLKEWSPQGERHKKTVQEFRAKYPKGFHWDDLPDDKEVAVCLDPLRDRVEESVREKVEEGLERYGGEAGFLDAIEKEQKGKMKDPYLAELKKSPVYSLVASELRRCKARTGLFDRLAGEYKKFNFDSFTYSMWRNEPFNSVHPYNRIDWRPVTRGIRVEELKRLRESAFLDRGSLEQIVDSKSYESDNPVAIFKKHWTKGEYVNRNLLLRLGIPENPAVEARDTLEAITQGDVVIRIGQREVEPKDLSVRYNELLIELRRLTEMRGYVLETEERAPKPKIHVVEQKLSPEPVPEWESRALQEAEERKEAVIKTEEKTEERPALTKELLHELRWVKGLSVREMSKKTRWAESTIYYHFKKEGVPIKSGKEEVRSQVRYASGSELQGEWLEVHLRRYPHDLRAEGDRLSIEHRDESYPIVRIEERLVAGEKIVEYHLKGGARFERWTRQGELIPPWETHWHQLPDAIRAYLEDGQLRDLAERAKNEAGGVRELSLEMEKLGVTFHEPNLRRILRGEQEGISISRLRALLAYLDIPYDSVKLSLVSGIKNIKPLIDLDTEHGGDLFAACRGDGGLSGPSKERLLFSYYNKNRELHESLIESVKKTIGDAHYNMSSDGQATRFTSSVVGYALAKGEAPVGTKTEIDASLPLVIRHGKEETARGYFKRLFSDEGTVTKSYVLYGTCINIHDRLKPKHKRMLGRVDWDERTMPGRNVIKFKRLTKKFEAKLSEDLVKLIKIPLRIISDESDLLWDRFSIATKLIPIEIHKTMRGYTVTWEVRTVGKASMRKILEKIGFADQEKQEKLERYVRELERRKQR